MNGDKRGLLKKAAQKMRQLHTECKTHRKRAHALKLIYKQAEMGHEEIPRTHKELEEKIASLSKQDLQVVEKALEMFGGNVKIGELDKVDPTVSRNADEAFQASILGENN